MVKRKSLVVYFKNDNFIKTLDRGINVSYVSKKNKYAILYMDECRVKGIKINLQRTKGVLDILDSNVALETF